MSLTETLSLPPSIAQIMTQRGLTGSAAEHFLNPSLDRLVSPSAFGDMETAVQRLLKAVRAEQPVAIYADRDVDGLSGLAILVRTLRSIGGTVLWGSPVKGRGVEREVLERLIKGAKVTPPPASGGGVIVLVDCGTGEHAELEWLASQGVDVIVADHHRFSAIRPTALAWIHPEMGVGGSVGRRVGETAQLELADPPSRRSTVPEQPAGCVMAFKLAQAIWLSFLGTEDPERMDYFLFSHLDLVCLGILADRMPLQGENRILVWHGLRRLAVTRKAGVSALTRFFRLTPRSGPLTVREVTWRLIPLLNAGGRLGRPDLTAELLVTEDVDVARDCIDQLLGLNVQRRTAQDKSLDAFEKAVLTQCAVDTDPVLVALSQDLEPSVTGLAAQALARKYGRPAFLFVNQGEHSVGSGRGVGEVDLFAWIEAQQDGVMKFGGHAGAVGLTLRTVDFENFRQRLLTQARHAAASGSTGPRESEDISSQPEAHVILEELSELWWTNLSRLSPFGTGHPLPLFQINNVETITPVRKRRSKKPLKEVLLQAGSCELRAEFDEGHPSPPPSPLSEGRGSKGEGYGEGPWDVIGYPMAVRGSEREFIWKIRTLWRSHGEGAKQDI